MSLIGILTWAHQLSAEFRFGELILVDDYFSSAQLASVEPDGSLRFVTPHGTRNVLPHQLVRWATPPEPSGPNQMVLTGGSRLVLGTAWTGETLLTLDHDGGTLTTDLLGTAHVVKDQLRILMFQNHVDSSQTDKVLAQLHAWQGDGDLLCFANGDSSAGHLLRFGPSAQPQQGGPDKTGNRPGRRSTRHVVTFLTSAGEIEIPLRAVAGIALGSDDDHETFGLAVGLRDGSWIVCKRLTGRAGRLHMETGSGLSLCCQKIQDIVSIWVLPERTTGGMLAYISDIDTDDYQHRPYLSIPWGIQRDRNVLGHWLRAGGSLYPKGIGMHSASRLVFRMNPSQPEQTPGRATDPHAGNRWDRFESQIAIDDAAQGGGSVIFHVLLGRRGAWRTAFSSEILRGDDPPQRISVPLTDADQIALEVDYADQGDERDYANWLDARLIGKGQAESANSPTSQVQLDREPE